MVRPDALLAHCGYAAVTRRYYHIGTMAPHPVNCCDKRAVDDKASELPFVRRHLNADWAPDKDSWDYLNLCLSLQLRQPLS